MLHRKKIRQTFASLQIRNYRLYFIGQIISTTGTWMQVIGQSWLVLKLTNSGTALGLAAALQFLPVLLIGPWGGIFIDRFPKRKLLYITQSVAGILALILAILVLTHTVTLWMVYVLAFGLGLVNAVDSPTRQTFIQEMVGQKNLLNAVSLNAVQFNFTRVVGPVIAALLIVTIGLAPLFFLNALSYCAVVVSLAMMNEEKLHLMPAVEKLKGQFTEGIRYIRNSPLLLHTLWMTGIVGVFTFEFSVTLPLMAQFTFAGTATTYALLTAGIGIGSIFGGIATARRKSTSLRELTNTAFFFGISMLIFSIAPTLVTAIIVTLAIGFFSINFMSLANVILQMESIPEMRGRVMSFWAVAYLGSTPIGGPLIGWISQYAGVRYGLALGGLAALSAGWLGSIGQKNIAFKKISEDVKIRDEGALEREGGRGKF